MLKLQTEEASSSEASSDAESDDSDARSISSTEQEMLVRACAVCLALSFHVFQLAC